MKKSTKEWLAKIAALNGVTEAEVLQYLRALSSGKRVIHHLRLADTPDYFSPKR